MELVVRGESPRILVVEDNREVAFYTGTLLASHYEVLYAADGEEGLEKARELIPDIVITDVMMPRMDGLELCRRIRHDELTCHIPVIAVTAKVTEKDRIEGLRAGATAYLNKPFNAEELLTLTGNLLQQQREIQKRFMRTISNKALEPATAGEDLQSPAENEVSKEWREEESFIEGKGQSSESRQACLDGRVATELDEVKSEMNELDRQFLEKLEKVLSETMGSRQTDIEHLASLMAMSHSQLRRKIGALTGLSAAKYITFLRIEKAKELLKQHPRVTITEVAFLTGQFSVRGSLKKRSSYLITTLFFPPTMLRPFCGFARRIPVRL